MYSCVAALCFVVIPSYISASTGSMNSAAADAEPTLFSSMHEFWPFRLAINLLGYASIVVPGYLFIRYVRSSKWLETAGSYLTFYFFLQIHVHVN